MSAQLPAPVPSNLPIPVVTHLLARTGVRLSESARTLKAQLRLHVPAARYHADPGLSISQLRLLDRSAQHFVHGVTNETEQTEPMRLGSAAHCAVLEPERYNRDYAVWDRVSDAGNLCPRRGQYWDKFVAEHPDQEIITVEQHEHAMLMQRSVRAEPLAMRYLQRGAAEVSMRWWMHGRLCRGRPDYLTTVERYPYLVGLKTARDASPYAFSNAGTRLGYHMQWAWYHDGYDLIRHTRPHLKEIVVESKPPYAVVVYDISDDVIAYGRDEYQRLLQRLQECEQANQWPGPGYGAEVAYQVAAWALQSGDDITGLGLDFGDNSIIEGEVES